MGVAKKLGLIAAGYCLAVAGGVAAVAVNESFIPDDVQQSSGGMVAFGDMIVFLLATGFLSVGPTWFLLKLWFEKSPRTLIVAGLLVAAVGPASWLAVRWMATTPNIQNLPAVLGEMLGVLIAFGAIPRIILGPVLLVIEGVTFVLVRGLLPRIILVAAMFMDLIPLTMFALHMAASAYHLTP